eukprot:scaffold2549_cov343-Prasinococcus_capsulatus_cf.AAC.10
MQEVCRQAVRRTATIVRLRGRLLVLLLNTNANSVPALPGQGSAGRRVYEHRAYLVCQKNSQAGAHHEWRTGDSVSTTPYEPRSLLWESRACLGAPVKLQHVLVARQVCGLFLDATLAVGGVGHVCRSSPVLARISRGHGSYGALNEPGAIASRPRGWGTAHQRPVPQMQHMFIELQRSGASAPCLVRMATARNLPLAALSVGHQRGGARPLLEIGAARVAVRAL